MKKESKLIVATSLIICSIFLASPNKTNSNVPLVRVSQARTTTIFNYVHARGNLAEQNKSLTSVSHNAVIYEKHAGVSDRVKKGDAILTLKKVDELGQIDAQVLSNVLYEDMISGKEISLVESSDDYVTIYSEIDGIITKMPESVGDTIVSGLPFLAISDTNNLIAVVDVPEKYASQVKTLQRVSITGDGFSGTITGQVQKVMPYAKKTFNILNQSSDVKVSVEIALDDTSKEILSGYSVEAKIAVSQKENAVVVPYEAIFQEEDSEYIYVYDNGYARKTLITTMYELDDDIEVTSGVNASDIIILDRNVEDGKQVRYE